MKKMKMDKLIAVGLLFTVLFTACKKDDDEKDSLTVARALQRIDTPSILFFLGILMTIAAMDSLGMIYGFGIQVQDTIVTTLVIKSLLD